MSTINIKLGHLALPLAEFSFENHRNVDNPDKPGKKKRETFTDTIIAPPIATVGDISNLFTAILNEAETRTPGNGAKLGFKILQDRLVDGNDTLLEAAKANKDENTTLAEYVTELVSLSRAPSKGLSAADITAKLGEYAIELAALTPILMGVKAVTEVVDANGKQVYANVDEATLRFAHLDRQIGNLQTLNAEREKRRIEARAKRDAKAAAAAAAAATAAAATPAPEPAH